MLTEVSAIMPPSPDPIAFGLRQVLSWWSKDVMEEAAYLLVTDAEPYREEEAEDTTRRSSRS